ncbi:general secretion pathway protein GspB [Paraferrimonas sedimenticola]|uniref:General secretion pathway protein GspB n=1 Tax=Paraferrimonas sedimenticola TaxID=375674 RepID=A0AA37RY02_9GAMM|nr:general secretion pathway protein GspB [Paraferrimonas sedimenticola]GLP97238.1 general secretion pathway protein GspB [Paraferrimonas sedimenticola]
MSILQQALDRSNGQAPIIEEEKPSKPWLPLLAVAVASALVTGAGVWYFVGQPAAEQGAAVQQTSTEVQSQPAVPTAGQKTLPKNGQVKVPAAEQTAIQPSNASQTGAEWRLAAKVPLPETQPVPSASNRAQSQTYIASTSVQPATPSVPVLSESQSDTEIVLADGSVVLGAEPSSQVAQQLLQQSEQPSQSQAEETQDPQQLVAAFQAALAQIESERALAKPMVDPSVDPLPKDAPQATDIPKPSQLPIAFQDQIPRFNISAHVYASEPQNRWLNVDGREMQQGDRIQGVLTIVEIRPQDVVLDLDGTEFRVGALAGW